MKAITLDALLTFLNIFIIKLVQNNSTFMVLIVRVWCKKLFHLINEKK